jgi:UDP-N-acetyl-D-mannosaminuronic acid transferase (WecB/TagA/CpsF family)
MQSNATKAQQRRAAALHRQRAFRRFVTTFETLTPSAGAVMSQPSSELREMISTAAEMRAAGKSWETVAAQVKRTPRTVRSWPQLYPRLWKSALREAQDQLLIGAAAESVIALRNQLRSKDEKLRHAAARDLLRARIDLAKLRARSKATPPRADDAQRIADYLARLNEAEAEALAEELPTPSSL